MHELGSRVGFEVELLAPRGSSRADLAHAIAAEIGGTVVDVWHRDSEPSAVAGMASFRHLTRGLEVRDAQGAWACSVVDDVTVVADLDVHAPPEPGWHRIVTDDPRLLNLLAETCDPAADIADVLTPVAGLFGTAVVRAGGGIHKVGDRDGASVAMVAPLPGERQRPAEIVTAPLRTGHGAALEQMLRPARELECTVPVEAAVHLHLDAAPFRTPHAFANVVALFAGWRGALWQLFGTNPACRRLAPLPSALVDLVEPIRKCESWEQVLATISAVQLTKYCDVNLLHLVRAPATKDTLEIRILPGSGCATEIMRHAATVEGLLQRCLAVEPIPATGSVSTLRRWGRKEW